MSKKPHRPRSSHHTERMKPFLTRVPADMLDWINDTAASAGLSRDAFMRQLLGGILQGFKAAEVEGTAESQLFRKVESSIIAATERAVREAVESALAAQAPRQAGKLAGTMMKGAKS